MTSALLIVMFCASIVTAAGLAGLVYWFVSSRSAKKDSSLTSAAVSSQTTTRGFKSWIPHLIIALILALWNISFAFFYLLTVWILRLDPKADLSHQVTDDEKKVCETNNKWLRNSSFITIPIFIIAIYMDVPPAIAALMPFVFHINLASRLRTDNLFVYRHTQQALFLLILRAATAMIIFSFFGLDEGFELFVLVNGSLWLFGTNWEIKQVKNNDCWLMRRRGEEIILPISDIPALDEDVNETLNSIDTKIKNTTVKKSLTAFRSGTPEERKKAVLVLSQLGEVEKF